MSDFKSPAVLGIDAAWTERHPSGVALLKKHGERWHCVRLAPSYAGFCDSDFSWDAPINGGIADVKILLEVCNSLIGDDGEIEAVAVDMPLATTPIAGRRAADNLVSQIFGGRKCAVHSPTLARPGAVGSRLTSEFVSSGFSLDVNSSRPPKALIEVYPHVALLSLMNASERLPYKASKTITYWGSSCVLSERKRRLLIQWKDILNCLRREIDGIDLVLRHGLDHSSLQYLKRYEDAIDALVCAWMATKYHQREASPIGDDSAAIWIPAGLN